jgi:hypothetical protein
MRMSCRMLPFAALLALAVSSSSARAAAGPAGHWEGKIRIPDREMAFVVDLAQGPAGSWIGSLSIPGSTSIDVPLENITIAENAVRFTAALPGPTSFEGTLSADASSLTGKVANPEGAVPFELARNGEAKVKVPPPSSVASKAFEGRWEGSVEVAGKVMRMVLKMSAAADGTARATVTNLDKGNVEIPASTVTIQGNQIDLDIRAVGGSYRGTLSAGGEIAGELAQQGVKIPLTFKRAAAVK